FVYYRAFWQRRCRAAAAGAVLKPQGGNYAVLPYIYSIRKRSIQNAHIKIKSTCSPDWPDFPG
ncbi:hypothetical protein, partial [Gemmiger sp.]|uniref:hypothetical protein n=1 Tax=Gemmiger sp. TaxID=2049027 RepID=UPI0025B8D713